MKKTLPILTTLLGLLITTQSLIRCAQAGVYQLSVSGPSTIGVNDPFSFDVYLTEQLGTGEATILGDSDYGLISGNFQVRVVSGASQLAKIVGNTAFDAYGGDVASAPWILNQSDTIVADGTPTGELVSAGLYRFKLGTFTGIGSSTAGTTTFEIADPNGSDPLFIDLMLGDGTSLDGSVFPSAQFSLTTTGGGSAVIPEPITLLSWSLVGGAIVANRRKSRSSMRSIGS